MNTKIIFLIITVLLGIWISLPSLNYQEALSQGDHGRDLYSFKLTAEGKLPYRDFSTQNGPLMFFYYAFFYKLFGVSVQSTLLGFNLLIFGTGIVLYCISAVFFSPMLSMNCALWYWVFRDREFFYTYNHNGATFMMALTLLGLFKYFETKKLRFTYLGAISIFCSMLIRPDIALACLVSFYTSVLLSDYALKEARWKNLPLYTVQNAAILGGALLIYWALTHGLAHYVTSYDLAYWKHTYWWKIYDNLRQLIASPFKQCSISRRATFVMALVVAASLQTIRVLWAKKMTAQEKNSIKLLITSLLLFILLTLCEYFLAMRSFRVYWSFIPALLLIFVFFHVTLKSMRPVLAKTLLAGFCAFSFCAAYQHVATVHLEKSKNKMLDINGNQVYLSWQHDSNWVQTVTEVVNFIDQHVAAGEKFAAIPYEPLYFFLSDRDSATEDLFFPLNQPERENLFLQQLKDNHVRYVIVSNRIFRSDAFPERKFGSTYGLVVQRYLTENFDVVATYGSWAETTLWINRHAVKVYKKRAD